MTHILTPEEFIIRAVNNYPSLYAAPTYDETKFRILDHTLNTIGNGMYMEYFMRDPVSDQEVADAQKWFNCSNAALGYMKTRQICDFVMSDGQPEIVVPIDEMKDHPEIVHWVEFDCSKARDPYPNFGKQYSMVYDIRDVNFKELGQEWTEAAIWFYEKCREYFMDDERVKGYHEAFPNKTERETKNTIFDYKQFLLDYQKYPDNESITDAYDCEFIGDRNNDDDVVAFITRRWNQKHKKILNFIDETIMMLKNG